MDMPCCNWHKNYGRWWVGRQAGAVAEVAITDAGLNSNKFWTGFYIYTLIFISNFSRLYITVCKMIAWVI